MKKFMHLRLITVCMLLSVVLHAAAKDFYAVLSNGTVTFYFDDNKASRGGEDIYSTTPHFYAEATKAVMDASMADYAPSFMTTWFYGCSALTSIEGMEYLNTSEVRQMNGLFQGCSSLTSLDLTGFDTSNVTTMNGMFAGCSSLTELDLSSFNTSKVKDMGGILAECSNLKTVYVDDNKWSTAAVTSENGGNMALFYGCGPLVGGNGTKFSDTNKEDLDYARVDKAGQPGYLTHKAGSSAGPAAATAEPYAVLSDNYKVLTFYYDNQKAARNGMSVGPFKSEVDPSWYYNRESITSVVFDDSFAKCTTLTSTAYWFCIFRNLSSISGISNLKTDNVTDMSSMFSHCSSLTSLDVTGFNTGKVTSMRSMFINCSGLTSLDLSGFNTEHVELMSYMFQSCSGLTTIYIGDGWSTANVLYSCDLYMFTNCTSLVGGAGTVYDSKHADRTYAHIDGGAENPGYFTDKNATPTPSADAEPYAVLSNDNTVLTFYYDNKKESRGGGLSIGPFNYVTSWNDYVKKITTVVFDNSFADYTELTSTYYWFAFCENLTTVKGIENLKTDNVTNMYAMFWQCKSLNSLDISGFKTDNVTNFNNTFAGCSSLTVLDVGHFNTEKVTNMHCMFSDCSGLTSLDVSHFKTDNVVYMGGLFGGCSSLTSIDISKFNTEKVTDMSTMFRNCSGLKKLDVTNLNTEKVTDMYFMFSGCSGLKSLDLSNFNTANVTNMGFMFSDCTNLETIYVGKEWSTAKVTSDMYNDKRLFSQCSKIVGGAGTVYSADHTDYSYAHIDGGMDNPGYFTAKNATPTPSADAEPYAVLSENNTVLTFYYDGNKASLNGYGIGPFELNDTRWGGNSGEITKVVFDSSFKNCTSITSTAYWFFECYSLTTIEGIDYLKTSNVVDMTAMFADCRNLTSLSLLNFDTSNVTHMNSMFQDCSNLVSLSLVGFNTEKVTDMNNMFRGCKKLPSLMLTDFNTKNVTDMWCMFFDCNALTALDIYNFDTSNVTNMNSMFQNCSSLSSVDLRGFNTEKVTNMGQMFGECSKLAKLDLSKFNTQNVTNFQALFMDCAELTTLDLTTFNTAKVEHMGQVFEGCSKLKTIYVDKDKWTTSAVTFGPGTFDGCTSLIGGAGTAYNAEQIDYTYARIDGGKDSPGYLTAKNATPTPSADAEPYAVLSQDNQTVTFYYDDQKTARGGIEINNKIIAVGSSSPYGSATKAVFDASFANYMPVSTAYWFMRCGSLTSIEGIENLNTANVTNMRWMFSFCSDLTSLDVSGFNTANVTDMGAMFYNCSHLTSLDVSGFKTDNVTNMGEMFYYCPSLTSLDVSGFKTDNVNGMSCMFIGCSGLTSLDVSGFKTDNVTDMISMFEGCSGLLSLDVSGFKTDNVTAMQGMFAGCSGLTSLDVSGFKTDNVTIMGEMFSGCSGLTSLDVSGFNTSNVISMTRMFQECYGLKTIYVGDGWSTAKVAYGDNMFSDCKSLKGGAGTAYNAEQTDYTYAHIDGGTENPGYFTSIEAKDEVVNFTNSKGWTFEGNLSTGEATLVSVNKDTEGETIVPETVINGGNAYTVTALRKDAFKDCSKIEKITIAKSIKDIECPAFAGCSSLKAFNVVKESAGKLSAVDGVLYSAVGTNDECLIAYPAAKASEFEIPASVKAIASGAFANAKLASLTVSFSEPLEIPADIFEGMDFDNCVLNVPLGTSSKYREHKVWGQFKNISGEKEVTVDDAVYQLDEEGTVTFVGVDKSKAVGDFVIPGSIKVDNVEVPIKEIAPNAFENCTGLVSVTIPANIQVIGDAAFKGCTGLEEIYCLSAVPIDLSKVFASRTRVMLTRSGEVITQFEGIDFETCILYVPAGSKNLYEQAEGWKQFKNIVEMGETVAITIGKAGKASYCGDKSLDFSFSDEVKAYIATGFDKDEGTIWLTRVKDVPAGVPVLIKGNANTTYDVPVTDSENSYYTNMFVGNTSGEKIQIQETDGDLVNYYLSGDGTFKSVNKTANIGTNKCYLQLPGTFEAAVTGATETVTVGKIGKASFAAPVDLDFTNVSGLKAFTATGYDKSTKTIWLTRVMKVQKGEGVLLKGDPNSYEIPSVAVQSSYENMFVGNTSGDQIQVNETSEDGSKTNYYLKGDGSFVSVNGYVNIKNNKCYLALPTSMVAVSSTRSAEDSYKFEEPEVIKLPIEFKSIGGDDEDGTTSIKNLTPALSEGEGEWYTLQGQRVAKPGKGLYIKNGKKVIVR